MENDSAGTSLRGCSIVEYLLSRMNFDISLPAVCRTATIFQTNARCVAPATMLVLQYISAFPNSKLVEDPTDTQAYNAATDAFK